MSRRPLWTHLVGVVAAVVVAVLLLVTLIPYGASSLFSPPLKGYSSLRFELLYYLIVALLPVAIWLIPPLVRHLGIGMIGIHRMILGRSWFYVRFPRPSPLRFRNTLLMSLAPFAVDMLAIVEIEYYLGNLTRRALTGSFFVAPTFLLLAGAITAVIPGAWLVNELGLRLLNPAKGEVLRASGLFDSFLGPLSAVALLVSFVTTLQSAHFSYAEGAFALGVWAVRLFPPVLIAVSVYRLFIEPRVIPKLEIWCQTKGIVVRDDLSKVLETISQGPTKQ
jgi:hypothetical protein